ncbi:sulfite exporter TauE/SafE family protein [uncultured Chitinophaga sp.]|uniref:urease accessory protein UreH domain-containing protein n=1 Tax=uncultured Chitinophaga sp. TaxID=339340 RepID=UPI0025EC8AB9|nr:sulfite exporter TauE/SafE family protein [uncultured Chitinophaga sp.]
MNAEIGALIVTAIGISCLHTVTGPDHYVPFIAISKARNWSLTKTIWWTIVCGIGHVGSSIVLGFLGILLGWQLSKLTGLEDVRGGIASWALLAFGTLYLIYGIRQAYLNRAHKHFDVYDDNSVYVYEHKHGEMPVYPQKRTKVTPWILFIIFVLGPCEPLIPLLTFPAVQQSTGGIILIASVFTIFTLITMVSMVLLGYYGFAFLQTGKIERYVHVIGGASITICGVGMVFLGW